MTEKNIEQHLVRKARETGGKAYKFVSPGNAGVPDRLLIFPSGKVIFVELKAPGKVPTNLQKAKHRELEKLKQRVFVIDSKEKVDTVLQQEKGCDV
jgi:hypothetical protein